MSLPVLIIGQGLAGTALAWRLWERGVPFLAVDRDEPSSCSKIAAGLLTPVTGMRMTLDENYGPRLCEAVKFYRAKERLLGQKFLHARHHVRLFKNDAESAKWVKRSQQTDVNRFLGYRKGPALVDTNHINNERGGFEMKHAGWLDSRRYLSASRDFFEHRGMWTQGSIAPDDIQFAVDRVYWSHRQFSHAALCTGWEAMNHPLFAWVPFEPARGAILTAQADLGGEKRVIHCGCWVQPREDGTLRIGSTYETGFSDPNGLDEAEIRDLQMKVHRLIKTPVHVLEQNVAVRPVIARRRTLIGRHPSQERLLFFNGLASNGALRSPHFARRLVEHVFNGVTLPAELDVRGNL